VAAASYHGAVIPRNEGSLPDQEGVGLLALAKQFRDAAASAGRPDVVAKIDEAILLLAGTGDAATESDKTNVVLRILDGFGF
jgi:hypothetical protein